jgi:hypothetical protein
MKLSQFLEKPRQTRASGPAIMPSRRITISNLMQAKLVASQRQVTAD